MVCISSQSALFVLHDHMEKYESILQSWRSKKYVFEFIANIVIQKEVMCDLRNANCPTLVVDESTHVSTIKILILYAKFCPQSDSNYKRIFAENLQLTACDSAAITAA